jgi:hypothetical protein
MFCSRVLRRPKIKILCNFQFYSYKPIYGQSTIFCKNLKVTDLFSSTELSKIFHSLLRNTI